MEGKRLIEKIRLRNILSFGDKGEEIELLPLNVIIGQNASGKSNLIDVIKLLRSITREKGLLRFVSESGGIKEWIWKGKHKDEIARISIKLNDLDIFTEYEISFAKTDYRNGILIENEIIKSSNLKEKVLDRNKFGELNSERIFSNEKVLSMEDSDSIMLWGRPFFSPPEIMNYSVIPLDGLKSFWILSDLYITRNSKLRHPQIPDAPNSFLEEDGSNLSLILNDFEYRNNPKAEVIKNLKKFNPQIIDYFIQILGGTVQLFIREEGLENPISAMRLSDGTLRYLCLLAILCHPEPPPLICIEEPEVGLHPDILPTIAELMKEASQRTQLIVTTHSDILVSAFSDMPEAVLVCEKDEDGTHFKRLEAEKLKVWLEEYTLGEAWLRGAIGGTRW